ncbi:MAG: macro domain-containing protein [Deltaproteobacteria bacterium]|nr:macro domain-containing protein [Deltaproteobacteria bacterium]
MKILIGDMLQSKAQTLINTVNCVGIMGKGIALEFKNRFPDMFADYARRCERGEVKPGIPYISKTLFPPHVINFPTKDHWKSASKIADIERGLQYLLAHYKEWGVTSLAIPPLGCGNGQLEWRIVGPMIYHYAGQMAIPVEIYAPYGTPPRQLTVEFLSQTGATSARHTGKQVPSAVNPAWVALVEILRRIEEQPYHWPVGRTIFQKIAYIATRQGLPTGFQYQKGSFGPFSNELKNAQANLINSGLIQEERLGKMFRIKVGPNYERVTDNYAASLTTWASIIEKTTDLFMRMDTEQAEIVATVIYTADSLQREDKAIPAETEVLESVMQWKQKRRPPLKEAAVASSIRNLAMLRWLDVEPAADLPVPDDEPLLAQATG